MGQYTLLEKIGEGGMGAVYRANHAMLRRPTAVKLLPPERAGAERVQRFEREVQLTSQLTHPNTISIFDYGRTPDGVFYYAMEYLEGVTLEQLVSIDGPQPAGRVIHVMRQVAASLSEAHGIGLVHRDIKPSNVILVAERGGAHDVAKVVDFGLVKEMEEDAGLTREGRLAGTPHYLAPEVITSSRDVVPQSDLYALGLRRVLPAHWTTRVRGEVGDRDLQPSSVHGTGSALCAAGAAGSRVAVGDSAGLSREIAGAAAGIGAGPGRDARRLPGRCRLDERLRARVVEPPRPGADGACAPAARRTCRCGEGVDEANPRGVNFPNA